MKKIALLLIIGVLCLSGCVTQTQETDKNKMKEPSSVQEEVVEKEEPKTEETVFSKLPESFTFSSGAGGWWTELYVNSDGTFYGNYHDSEMGSTGDGYPCGTCYICEFEGKFTQPKQVSEYVYSTSVENIDFEEAGREYIEDEIKYITSEPYGLENAGEILIYLCGAPRTQVPEGFISWLPEREMTTDTLEYYGIYNVNEQTAFIGMQYEEEQEQTEVISEAADSMQLFLGDHYLSEWDETEKMCEAQWQSLSLGEESAIKYPELAGKLQEINRESSEYAHKYMEEMLLSAKEAAEWMDYFIPFSSDSRYYVQRADDAVLSVRSEESEYTGGAHPYYWSRGINLDPVSGQELKLSDVLTDTSGVSAILTEKLSEKYNETPFFSLEETLAEYKEENYTWTLNYQGITFYFSPYEIASYADGTFQITLWYDEMPELFAEKYMTAPTNGWAIPLQDGREFEVDRQEGDGKTDCLYLFSMLQESDYYEMYVTLNDRKIFLEECNGYTITPHLVCLNDSGTSRYYLYVETKRESDYTSIYIYDMNGDDIVLCSELSGVGFAGYWDEDAEGGTWYEGVFHNPPEVVLDTTIHMLGTWNGSRTYRANLKNGILEANTDYYNVSNNGNPIVSKRELEVVILPQQTKEVLPSGTKYYIKRTDGKTYAEFELEDGRECRMEIKVVDYTPTIQGVSEWDCFEELWYAG